MASIVMVRRVCRSAAGSEFCADALFEASDLGGDIGFAQAEYFRDLALPALVEVEQQQRAVQRRLPFDEAL